jgi:hypothetical protein
MSTLHRLLVRTLCCAALLSLGCDDGGGDDDTDHHDDASSDADHPDGHVGHDDEDEKPVPCTDAHPALAPGLSDTRGDLTLKLVSGDPTRARKDVRNDWIVELVDGSGAPVTNATFTRARSHMEVHDHPGLPAPTLADEAGPGRKKLDNIIFTMRGPWEVYVTVEPEGARPVTFQLNVCVD